MNMCAAVEGVKPMNSRAATEDVESGREVVRVSGVSGDG